MMAFYRSGLIGIVGFLLLPVSQAYAEGCKIEDLKLHCGKADSAIISALSSDETVSVFETPEDSLHLFKRPFDLETFRRSVETNWRAVNRVEKRQRQKMLRRAISADEFDDWSKIYIKAEENYRSAMNFYRTLVWYGKTGKPAPKDD